MKPISLQSFVQKVKHKDKYLGQIIGSSLATSAFGTVKYRTGKIKGAALELKHIIEDFQTKAITVLSVGAALFSCAK